MDKAECEALLNYITKKEQAYPGEYSKGEKRRLLTQFRF